MAISFNTPSNNAAAGTNNNWKATAFLNVWVRRADGSRAKIGSISLKDSRSFERALIERLQQDGALEALQGAMELDFQMADKPVSAANVGF